MNSILSVGDRVLFDKSNSRWCADRKNPAEVEGVVVEVNSVILVQWDNGEENGYFNSDEDLKKI